MVVGAFPIAKLSVLLIKQISKPIANVCKERAKNSPFFRTYVCMPPAQFYNWCEVKAKMWILNLGKPVNIPVLSQEMAIELGANLLGETVIFVIGSALLIVEYNRQSKKETAKETKRKEEMDHVTSTITDLYFTIQRQQTQLREMERMINSISVDKPVEPPPLPSGGSSGGSAGGFKNSPAFKPPAAPAAGNPTAGQDMSQPAYTMYTPYPNKSIILQSLNYIQMDAFSSLFPKSSVNILEENEENKEKVTTTYKREPAILSMALYDIENNFKSLF